MKQDQIFQKKLKSIKGFEFNQEVATVFDDMVGRSVPFYNEIHRIILDLVDRNNLTNKSLIYDLGCSTGTTISLISKHLKAKKISPRFIGVDNSAPMLEICEQKLLKNNVENVELICDGVENVSLEPSKIIIMNYTLQFIPTNKRLELAKKIYRNLEKGGFFILSEKIKGHSTTINNLLTDLYYDFKRRNGYSELEIAQKREALENVLIPLTPEKQIDLLKTSGFSKVDVLFRWYNFSCFIGIK